MLFISLLENNMLSNKKKLRKDLHERAKCS